ncbi:hypothetical protein [Mycobacterium malmoense]|uniref:hypothetical protein n=1 Tax=Mycobacterium malmoense TaxID=1780 RepID=UPI00159ED568|nr:hypothetical protein [Mycobacterium malmoense]
MRAEEGDESVNDYVAEGEQALGRIKASQRARIRLGDVAKRFARLWRGDHAPRNERGPG